MPSNDQPCAEDSPREQFAAALIEQLREHEPEVVIDITVEDVLRASDLLAAGIVTVGQVASMALRALFGEAQ